jgi:hypothetical protein
MEAKTTIHSYTLIIKANKNFEMVINCVQFYKSAFVIDPRVLSRAVGSSIRFFEIPFGYRMQY